MSTIRLEKTSQSRINEVDFDNIPFGKIFSDHMFVMDYSNGQWSDPRIVPFDKLSIHPATSALHYGQAIFEGLKAYKSVDDGAQMFRPERNISRLNQSARRMAMPEVPEGIFMDALKELVYLDRNWIPGTPESSLYIRPFMIGTDEYIGIKASDSYKFIIFTCPVQAYYSAPVKVLASDEYVRAMPGGVGTAKTAGNYAATLYPASLAKQKGYDQIMWLDGRDFDTIHEIGTMNVFFHIGDKVITPSLELNAILEGVTRDSAIQLLKDKGYTVEERKITITEVMEAHDKGTLKDAFGTGTAATISHIAELGFRDKHIVLPPVEGREVSNYLKTTLDDIKYGRAEDTYGWMYKVEEELALD